MIHYVQSKCAEVMHDELGRCKKILIAFHSMNYFRFCMPTILAQIEMGKALPMQPIRGSKN